MRFRLGSILALFFLFFFGFASPSLASMKIGSYWYVNSSMRMTYEATGDITSQINCSHNFDFLETTSGTHHYFTNCSTSYSTYTFVNTSTTGFGNSQVFELWDLTGDPTPTVTPTPTDNLNVYIAGYSSGSADLASIENYLKFDGVFKLLVVFGLFMLVSYSIFTKT